MDIVTHGILGALSAMAVSKNRHLRQASVCGLVAGLLPDADVFIRSATDPLLTLQYHRHFTHSLLFAPLGAMLASLFLWLVFRKQLRWRQVYGFALVGYLSAILLDVGTSYGSHLFWPFIDSAVELSIIAVADPLFSVVLLLGLGASLYWRVCRPVRMALMLAGVYLALGAVQHWRVEGVALQLAQQRGIEPERILVKPTMGNILLWRAMTVTEQTVLSDGVRVGLFAPTKIYMGDETPLVRPLDWQSLPSDSPAYGQLQRFYHLANQLVVKHPSHKTLYGDARYAMLPTSNAPLWGIVINPEKPFEPVRFVTRRELTPEKRQQFVDMLRGRDGKLINDVIADEWRTNGNNRAEL